MSTIPKPDLSVQLQERVKELTCLYQLSKIAQSYSGNIEETLLNMCVLIPTGWQYPDMVFANIYLDKKWMRVCETEFDSMESDININGITIGKVRVSYLVKNANATALFLNEEQQLIEQIAEQIGSSILKHLQHEKEKVLEFTMRQNDRLKILAELTASIAHELNTPLGNILGFAELLKKEEPNHSKRNDLSRIISSAIQGREIVKKLMYFSCEMPTQFKKQDLNSLILESIKLIKLQFNEKSIQVTLNLKDGLPEILIDPLQLTQVLFNLCLNAIHAMPNKGKLGISTDFDNHHCTLKISDNGIGMSKAIQTRIFQPFFTTKPAGEGTGLGLAVVYGIIQNHRAQLSVDSTENFGTTFTIKFPL